MTTSLSQVGARRWFFIFSLLLYTNLLSPLVHLPVPSLIKDCHLVLNDSKVLDARLSVTTAPGNKTELMLLDLGNICPQSPCREFTVQAMIRHDCVSKGDIYSINDSQVEVVEVRGVWEEDEESGGNGTVSARALLHSFASSNLSLGLLRSHTE